MCARSLLQKRDVFVTRDSVTRVASFPNPVSSKRPMSHAIHHIPPQPTRLVGRGALLAVMCVGMFLVQLDVTVVNVALPTIRTALHTDLAGQQWVVDAYAIV